MPGHARILAAAALVFALGTAAARAGAHSAADTALGRAARGLAPGAWAEVHAKGQDYALFKADNHHIFEYTDDAMWYPARQEWLFLGQGHLSPPLKFVTYSAYSNTFRAMPTPPWAIGEKWGHAYDNNAIDTARGIVYYHQSDSLMVYAYDIAGRRWSALPPIEGASHAHGTALAYFPEMDALVRVLRGTVRIFRMKTRRWTVAAENLPMGTYHNFAKYDSRHGAVMLGGGNGGKQVYRLAADGKITRYRDCPVEIGMANSLGIAPDPGTGDLLVFSFDGALHALDVERNAWRLVARETPMRHVKAVVTPLVDHGVIMFVTIQPEKVLLYRYAPRAAAGAG